MICKHYLITRSVFIIYSEMFSFVNSSILSLKFSSLDKGKETSLFAQSCHG